METGSPSPPSSPLPNRQLKRLRRVSSAAPDELPPADSLSGAPDPFQTAADGLDPLFESRGHSMECEAGDPRRKVEVDGGGSSGKEKKSAKKRLCLDGEEEENIEKKKRKGKGKEVMSGDGTSQKESVREKRRLEKERKAYLEQLHAESQRLLRETKDASFNPAPLVQKPISSILEKIRLRKLEAMKRASELYCMDFSVESNSSEKVNINCNDSSGFGNDSKEHPKDLERENDMMAFRSRKNAVVDNPHEDAVCGLGLDSDLENADHEPGTDIPQDSFCTSPIKHAEDSRLEKQFDSSPDNNYPENNAQCELMTDSKNALDLTDETTSDEEDNDKENTDPLKDKSTRPDLSEKLDLAKPFIDDEADEEDDSDHDLMRFPEEDEEDEGDTEEMNDLIETGYEELPIDQERRNQLHQEWLEQKDNVETRNMLQRLKHKRKKEDPAKECPVENLDEELEVNLNENVLANAARENSRKAKQSMAQMFSTVEDDFVSSDEEEVENRLSRQRILERAEESTSILSAVDNANSKEVFNLIKKLNIAPDPKNRRKPVATTYESLHFCGNSNSSSKSSFLGRTTSNSLQSSHKQNTATAKAFIFSRDDSNSRSALTKLEDSCDTDQREDQHPKPASARFTSSQPKACCSKSDSGAETSAGPSLFDILRRSSVLYDQQLKASEQKKTVVSETQIAKQLSFFKPGRGISKRETSLGKGN